LNILTNPYRSFFIIIIFSLFSNSLLAGSDKEVNTEQTSIASRLTWYRLRELQAQKSNEVAFRSGHTISSDEKGWHQTASGRFYSRANISLISALHHFDYKSRLTKDNENLSSLDLSLIVNRINEELFAQIQTGHHGKPGLILNWEKSVKTGASFGITLGNREPQRTSLSSLKFCESHDFAKAQVSFQLPSELFLITESNFFESRLDCPSKEIGRGNNHLMLFGFSITDNPNRELKGFQGSTMRYEDVLRQHLYLAFSQQYRRFKANNAYLSKISPARKSYEQKIILEIALPLTPHFGYFFNASIGQDLARSLHFAKIKGLKNYFKWIPTHRTQYQIEYNFSTENTGRLKGNLSEFNLSINVNI